MVYKTLSSKAIIARVFRDTKPGSADWVIDAVEWLGDVVERIGVHVSLIDKQAQAVSENLRIPYPCDMEHLEWVEYEGNPLPYGGGRADLCSSSKLVYQYQGSYFITNDSYVITSFDKMQVTLHYKAFPVDEEGYPLIPDNFYFKTACFWYICSRLAMREQIKMKYDYCEERFNTYAVLAENDCNFPSFENMHRFKERWCRIVPNLHANFYNDPSLTHFLEVI